MLIRRQRRAQRGQALVLVLAFMLFFTLVAFAVVGLAKAVSSQRASTEATATIDSATEGAGQFSMADVAAQQCGTSGGGTMNFGATSDGLFSSQTLQYSLTTVGCTNSTTGGSAPGANCLLCVLNSSQTSPATVVINTNNKGLSVPGEVDANGSVAGGGLSSTGPNSKIGLQSGASCGKCTPAATTLPRPITDPLKGKYPFPQASAMQSCCGSGVINPGVYSGMSVNSPVFMTSGVYIATGAISVSGTGALTNSDSDSGGNGDANTGGPADTDSGGSSDSNSIGLSDAGSGVAVSYANKGNGATLTDMSKKWATNIWKDALVTVTLPGPTTETNRVSSNNGTTLTLASTWSTVPAAGSAYQINTLAYTPNTLIDTQKNWTANQWAGAFVTVSLPGNKTTSGTVTGNTPDTLTMTANWSTTPPPGSAYQIHTLAYTSNSLIDSQKNWATDQWKGAFVSVTLPGNTTVTNMVVSNTAHVLTMQANWSTTPPAGSAYKIYTVLYSANTLVDISKNWTINEWAGALVTVTLGTNTTETATIKSNTANTLTLNANWGTTPPPGSAYRIDTIYYTPNTLVDLQKSWTTNQFAGARVTVTLPGNATVTGTAQSNTSHTITLASNWTTTPPPGSAYVAADPVLIYLACNTSAPFWICSGSGQAGGSITTSGNGTINITNVSTGAYGGLSIYADPNLTDPTGGFVLNLSGNGSGIGGTIDVPRGSLSVQGGGVSGGLGVGGRVVIQSIYTAGDPNAQLTFTGASSTSTSTCFYYNETVTGSQASPANSLGGHLVFESGCGATGVNTSGRASPTTVISFSYGL